MEVDSKEVESGMFGASTHAAVSAFNERRVGLKDAPHCDEATWYIFYTPCALLALSPAAA